MLDKYIVRKFTLTDCQIRREAIKGWLDLTAIRISRLLATKEKNPGWAAYDKYAGDIVNIDIRIEEQYAVKEDFEADLQLITEREDILRREGAIEPRKHNPGKQLTLFDLAQIERWRC